MPVRVRYLRHLQPGVQLEGCLRQRIERGKAHLGRRMELMGRGDHGGIDVVAGDVDQRFGGELLRMRDNQPERSRTTETTAAREKRRVIGVRASVLACPSLRHPWTVLCAPLYRVQESRMRCLIPDNELAAPPASATSGCRASRCMDAKLLYRPDPPNARHTVNRRLCAAFCAAARVPRAGPPSPPRAPVHPSAAAPAPPPHLPP